MRHGARWVLYHNRHLSVGRNDMSRGVHHSHSETTSSSALEHVAAYYMRFEKRFTPRSRLTSFFLAMETRNTTCREGHETLMRSSQLCATGKGGCVCQCDGAGANHVTRTFRKSSISSIFAYLRALLRHWLSLEESRVSGYHCAIDYFSEKRIVIQSVED